MMFKNWKASRKRTRTTRSIVDQCAYIIKRQGSTVRASGIYVGAMWQFEGNGLCVTIEQTETFTMMSNPEWETNVTLEDGTHVFKAHDRGEWEPRYLKIARFNNGSWTDALKQLCAQISKEYVEQELN